MGSVPNKSTQRRTFTSANDWPSTPEIDGYVWNIGPDPSDADAAWAAENLNDDYHVDDPIPNEVLEQQAEAAAALDLIQRGIRPF